MQVEVVTGVEAANWARDKGDIDILAAGHPVESVHDTPFVLL